MDLFTHAHKDSLEGQPLPEILRPRRLEDMLGQPKILGQRAPWRKLLESGQVPSLILWGPPGTGKTTFALLLAQKVDAEFITVNAVETGAKALRELGDAGRRRRLEHRRRTFLFVDEIHRLNKGQQDVLLPFIEKGDLVLIGATTENPSYEINSALLSRCRILVFERLGETDLKTLARRASEAKNADLDQILTPEGLTELIEFADGDGRRLLNLMELLLSLHAETVSAGAGSVSTKAASEVVESLDVNDTSARRNLARQVSSDDQELTAPFTNETHEEMAAEGHGGGDEEFDTDTDAKIDEDSMREESRARAVQGSSYSETEPADSSIQFPLNPEALAIVLDRPALRYDKTADEHYDTISAFIKSVRGSDPDAAMYYLARMIKGGEDPIFIARRLVILASEDISNADPRALTLAISGLQAVELVGWPEAAISLAQVTTYLASAPKSNRSYMALHKAQELVERTGTIPIPLALRSAKTSSMKKLGYGKGYRYSHDGEKGYLPQRFLPEELGEVSLYEPTDHGFEKNIRQYLAWLRS